MPEYLAPGVYVEERPAPQTIEGVSTSTAGFVGAAMRGPTVGLPQLVTSFADFVRKYGSHLDEEWGPARHLASAVEGFFDNGGQRAYVARVVGAGAAAAARTYFDGFNTALVEDTPAAQGARHTVRLGTLRGISVGTHLTFSEVFAGAERRETRRVMAYTVATQTVVLDTPLVSRYTAAKCVVTIEGVPAPVENGSNPSLRVEAVNEGFWSNALRVTVGFSTGATALAAAGAVTAATELAPVPLAFADSGPAAGATSVELDSVTELVPAESVVEFDDGAGTTERRTVTGIEDDVIRWDRPITGDYTAAGATISRVDRVLRPTEARLLAFDTDGPASGAEEIDLADATGVTAGDVLEFRDPETPTVEQVTVTGVTDATVSWSGALDGDYSGADATVRHFPSPRASVQSAAGFAPGALVRISEGAATQVLQISAVTGTELAFHAATYPLLRSYDAGALLSLALAGTAGGSSVDLASTSNFSPGALIEIDRGGRQTYHRVSSISGNTLVLSAPVGVDVPQGATVRVVALSLVVDDGASTEGFDQLSLDPDSDAYAPRVVNLRSRLVRVTDLASTAQVPFTFPQVRWAERNAEPPTDPRRLTGGADGAQPPAAGAYLGQDLGPGQRSGIAALADIDAISMMAVPGIADAPVQGALLAQCENRKDRFAVLDPLEGSVIGSGGPDDVVLQRNRFDSLYGAIYYPWLRIRDPLDEENTEGILVPPSGHVLGVYARTDVERGVHKAPANEVIRGIRDLEVKLSEREQAVLNPVHVNVLRDFRDSQRGLRVWGARCITSNQAWKYVSVRRLFIFLEESLYVGLQFAVFEPNAEPLWAQVRRTVSGFLRRVWRDGALEGLTEDEAFFVRCDRSTMTEDDIANGRLVVVVGAAPVRPAEFVILRIEQKTLEAAA